MFEGALHRFSGKAVEKRVADTQTHQQLAPRVLSHSSITGRSTVRGVIINVLQQSGEDARCPKPEGIFTVIFPLFTCMCFLVFSIGLLASFSAASSEKSRHGQTHPHAHKVSHSSHTHTHRQIFTLDQAHAYICSHTRLFSRVCGGVSVWLITVCSPPQMPAQDQETTVRLLTSSSSSAPTQHVLLINVFLLLTHCRPPPKLFPTKSQINRRVM